MGVLDTFSNIQCISSAVQAGCSQVFMKELTDLSGKQVSMEGSSKPETENAGDQGTGAAAPIHHAEGIALQKSMQHQASKVGIMVDAIIVDKRMTCTNTFKVISIDDTAAEVKECVLGEVVEPPKTVPMAELMEHFKLSKAKLSSNVPGWPSAALISSPVVCSEVKFDILKGKILDGCTQVYHDHQSVLWGGCGCCRTRTRSWLQQISRRRNLCWWRARRQ